MSFVLYLSVLSLIGAINLTLSLLLMWRGGLLKRLFQGRRAWLWRGWHLSVALLVTTLTLFLDEHRASMSVPEVWLCVIGCLGVWVWVELNAPQSTSE